MTPVHPLQAVLAAAILSMPVTQVAFGQGGAEVQCYRDGAVRRIEVVRDPAPRRRCEMRYGEPGFGQASRVVWFSERDRGFCHERADALIARLARRGWVCDVMPKRNVALGSGREAYAGSGACTGPALVVPRPP